MRLPILPLGWGLVLALASAGGCSRHKETAAPVTSAVTPSSTPSAGSTAPLSPVEPLLSYELRLGKQLFQHYCLTCHGKTGGGDGFNAFNIDPHPRDLSDPTFQKAKSDAELAGAINRGGVGVGLSPMMPPWGKTLMPDQIDAVVRYVRTLKCADVHP